MPAYICWIVPFYNQTLPCEKSETSRNFVAPFSFSSSAQVTPFHHPGTAGVMMETKMGKFKPALPFSSPRSVGANASFFGSIVAIQRMSSKSLELARQSEDQYNDLFGFFVTFAYYRTFFSSTRRYLLHNRAIGAGFTFTLAYSMLS